MIFYITRYLKVTILLSRTTYVLCFEVDVDPQSFQNVALIMNIGMEGNV